MFDRMFANAEGKLKSLAKIIFWLGIIVAVVASCGQMQGPGKSAEIIFSSIVWLVLYGGRKLAGVARHTCLWRACGKFR